MDSSQKCFSIKTSRKLLTHSKLNFSQALDDEFTKVVDSKFNGSVIDFLNAVTVSCEDFVMMCKLGLRSEMPGDQCCREVFAKEVNYDLHVHVSNPILEHTLI